MITSNKITMYTVIKEQTTVYILYLTKEFLYGIFLMTKLKILKHIFLFNKTLSTIRSTVLDSSFRFIFRFESETGQLSRTKCRIALSIFTE
jgi:hypothetical protein